MKKLLLACLLLTGWSQAQNITFKDPHFKNFIVNYWNYDTQGNKVKVDLNNDGEISVDESLTLGDIVINDTNIVSLDDIENFINLRGFYLRNNKNIDSIDLSKLTNLQTLDIDNLENLIYLNLSNTKVDNFYNSFFLSNLPQITTLIFSNTPIRYLSFGSNNLTNVEISNNPNLWFLSIYGPKLTNIDISTDTNLSNLYLNNTKISNLDLSKNIELIDLGLNNEIKNLDLSNNLKLDSLTTGTNLQYLNLKKGSHMSYVKLAKPSKRLYICADDQNIPLIEQSIKDSNLVNVEVNSYCTFTPGGVYNTITSNVKYDLTGNCTGNDNFTLFTKFSIEDKNGKGTSVTNKQGMVNFYKQAGTYTLIPQLENPTYFQISPSLVNFNLMDNSGHDTTINYCITPNGIHNDLEIVLSPIGPARPGFDSKYQVTYKNKGNQTLSGDFTVEYNDSVLDLVASSLNAVSIGKLGKSFVDLKPFEISVSDTIVFKVNSPIEVPAVNIGDTLKFITTINPLQGDEKPEDNVSKFNQIVVGAYDPNIITCLQGNVLPSKEIGKTLHYTIDFENTGNYPAENIVVVETIDPKKYDINSIQILNTSHPMKLRIEGNKVEYYFQNIDLGEHKHGNILLKLRALSNLIEGDTINKQANIYFDYNAPVETNKETTVYKDQLLASIKGISLDESIIAYPNPNNGLFTLKAANQISSVEIYDLHGRSIQTIIVNDFTNKIDLSNQDAGIYLLKVTTDTGANVIEIKKD